MIKHSALFAIAFCLLLVFNTTTHSRTLPYVAGVLVLNWGYHAGQQLIDMQRRNLAATLKRTEEEIGREYPRITFMNTSAQLAQDTLCLLRDAIVNVNNGKAQEALKNELEKFDLNNNH